MSEPRPGGFTIVFGGPEFQPADFLQDSKLASAAKVVMRGQSLRNGHPAAESWLEFSDLQAGGLDTATEALDLLQAHRQEFRRLAQAPGVVTRSLNIFGTAESCSLELAPEDIALLHELGLHLSVLPYR